MSKVTLDFETLPLDSAFRNGNHRDVQIMFDADFERLSWREQRDLKELLSKQSFNKEDAT